MKKLFLTPGMVLAIVVFSFAQSVGINNNTPHASAALDVTSTTKGVLIPRLTATERLDIANPAKGLLVFDSTSNSFWYQNGAEWQELVPATNAWKLTGNSGTDTAVNFLGTTDGQPLLFKVNNLVSGKIDFAGNTGFGLSTLPLNSGNGNSAFGYFALNANNIGANNVATGYGALYNNTTGSDNVANGQGALYINTIGGRNVAVGKSSLYFNTGSDNTAAGFASLYGDATGSSGSYNTSTGSRSMQLNKTGSSNTANGYEALFNNTSGYSNVAVGIRALYNNTIHSNLVAIGDSALYNNGVIAGFLNDDAVFNTALGSKTLYSNTTGSYNTGTGKLALYANTIGRGNTADGVEALASNTTGGSNTAIGYAALFNSQDGFFNTAIGANASGSTVALTNATAIGAGAIVNASNKVRIGNSQVTVIEGQVDWSFPSDGRFKTNITESVKGLDFITKLRPVVYNFQTKKYDEFLRKDMPKKNAQFAISQDFSESESIRHSGFVAQEVEKAAKEAGYDFNGIIAPKNGKQTYSLSYSQFVVPLVKAVQEQQQQIEVLKIENARLTTGQEELKARLIKLEALVGGRK